MATDHPFRPGADLLVFPNPASDEGIWLVAPGAGRAPVELSLRDMAGREVLRRSIVLGDDRACHLDLRGTAPGQYVIILSAGAERWQQFLVVHSSAGQ